MASNLLDPYDRWGASNNQLDPGYTSLWSPSNPVGTSSLGEQSLTMPSADVSPIVNWFGQHPVTAQTQADAVRLAGNMLQFGPADVAATRVLSSPMANPAFREWFGNSQMVDKAGNPQTLYHGTADDIEAFEHGHPNQKDSGWLGKGFYFWNEPHLASDYTLLKRGDAPNVIPVHLKLENPYYATEADKESLMLRSARDQFASTDFTNSLRDQGYDGVILNYSHKPGLQEVMAFEPHQVKSAIGNRGTYSPTDPRINYGIAGLLGGGAAAGAASEQQ